jgi:hypothetical protein
MAPDPPTFWIVLGLDVVEERLIVESCDISKEVALQKALEREKNDAAFYCFEFGRDPVKAAIDLVRWLHGRGLTLDDARDTAREFVRSMGMQFKRAERHQKKRGDRPRKEPFRRMD